MFKMDMSGNGIMIERSDINKALNLRPDVYSFEKFRYMCILSGCDYLPNLPGIGLGKSSKVFQITRQTDVRQVCLCTFELSICIFHSLGSVIINTISNFNW